MLGRYDFAEELFVAKKSFSTEHQALAEVQLQQQSWKRLASLAAETEDETIKDYSDNLSHKLEQAGAFPITGSTNNWTVEGRIPLLSEPGAAQSLVADPWTIISVILVDAGPSLLGIDPPISVQLNMHISAYQAFKAYRIHSRDQMADVERRLKAAEQNLNNEAKRTRNYSVATEKAIVGLEGFKVALIEEQNVALSKLDIHIDDEALTAQKRHEEFRQFLAKGQEQIDAAAKSVVEAGILGEAISVWRKKVVAHRTLFWGGLGLLFGGFIAFAQNAPGFWLEYGQTIRRTETGDVPYTELIGLLAALGAIIWLTRIVVRLVFTAQALADDAVQRRAFLETYLRLVRDPDAKMETNDRILVLNAIFRPLPGHQTEDVAPPTIADLIRERIPK